MPHYTVVRLVIGICALIFSGSLRSQVLYPGLSGNQLLTAVQNDYTPNITFSYAEARDTMYARIDSRNDTVRGIYTDFPVYLEPNTDPTVTLFDGGLNTEHIYPQGKGATDGSPAHRNMHHLAAARINVNGDRASLPFSEIPDPVTNKWYLNDQVLTSIPLINRDAYSEGTGLFFEPRESVKGNVARAVFYIHAIYRDQVQAVDPIFFESQRQDLCAWHFADPVDVTELDRTDKIANYQSGKENPFVLDCTLAERMYCSGLGECMSANEHVYQSNSILIELFQNPLLGSYFIKNNDSKSIDFDIQIHSMDGREVFSQERQNIPASALWEIPTQELAGIYFIQIRAIDGNHWQSLMLVL